MRKGNIIELKIDRIAQGGRGVGRSQGLVVFVEGAIPGDTVRALLKTKKKDFAEAGVVEIILSSPDRVQAACPYFGYCGGCRWQHVTYERQLEYKKSLVMEAMCRIGGLDDILIHEPMGSERIYGYRNKMEFSFSDKPWVIDRPSSLLSPAISPSPAPPSGGKGPIPSPLEKKNGERFAEGGRGDSLRALVLGLHVPGTFNKVIDVESCLLQEERGNEILRAVKRFAWESGLAPYNLKTHGGFWRFLTLRSSRFLKEWMVNVITSEYRKDLAENLGRHITSTFPDVKTVVNNVTARRAGVAVGEWESVVSGPGFIEDRIGAYAFQISANSFFQTNTAGAEKLYLKVAEFAELTGSENVVDLYSGTGTISIFLASRSKRVIGMEISGTALEDAEKNCRTNRIEKCRFILGDIRAALPSLSFKPDVLIIDPPRAGMHKDVTAKILELGTEKIIYISCNPVTMARDLGEMKDYYEVVEIQPIDMFPHTHHVESVAKLRKRKMVRAVRPHGTPEDFC
ncbi:MAG: 23S rRNA (uracil(1939)-C(5))-methyltransferase RlmD [Deltaproteobacteria bacterium]|nr:23S rRNA (uracil(1939)-C(5))-methyltransferase RlmD [Deltaproteobacteria bacterium]